MSYWMKLTLVGCCLLLNCVTSRHGIADTIPAEVEAQLLQRLAGAESQQEGRHVEGELWEFWFNEAPDSQARQLLDDGRRRRESYDYAGAEALFDQLIESRPQFIEAYNQRAFVRFLREDFVGALADLEMTLQMKPWHFGALSGTYHVLRVLNRHGVAFDTLRQAVEIHPWIQERSALPQDRWPERYRQLQQRLRGSDLEI